MKPRKESMARAFILAKLLPTVRSESRILRQFSAGHHHPRFKGCQITLLGAYSFILRGERRETAKENDG